MRLFTVDFACFVVTQKDSLLLASLTSQTLDSSLNAFLDTFGRIRVCFFQKRLSADRVLLVFPSLFVDRFLSFLSPLLALSKATCERLDRCVFFDLDAMYTLSSSDVAIALASGRLVVSTAAVASTISLAEFTSYRLASFLPLQGVDFDAEMALCVDVRLVSFSKGCFPGQEIVARVRTYGKPPQQLTVVRVADLSSVNRARVTSVAVVAGVEQGFLFV